MVPSGPDGSPASPSAGSASHRDDADPPYDAEP